MKNEYLLVEFFGTSERLSEYQVPVIHGILDIARSGDRGIQAMSLDVHSSWMSLRERGIFSMSFNLEGFEPY